MTDFETQLRELLREAAPTTLPVDGLADGARGYAARSRRVRITLTASLAAVALVIAGFAVGALRAKPAVPAVPMKTLPRSVDCSSADAAKASVAPSSTVATPTADVVALWICPAKGTDPRSSEGEPWTLPAGRIPIPAGQGALGTLGLLPPDTAGAAADCTKYPHGPPFVVVTETANGSHGAYPSTAMWCGGGTTLTQLLPLLADAELDARPAASSTEPGCRSLDTARRTAVRSGADPAPVASAHLCLSPSWMRFVEAEHTSYPVPGMASREAADVVLDATQIAQLNEGLPATYQGFFTGNGECGGEGAWTYSLQGVRANGDRFLLATSCLDEFRIDGLPVPSGSGRGSGYIPTAETTAMLRAIVATVPQ